MRISRLLFCTRSPRYSALTLLILVSLLVQGAAPAFARETGDVSTEESLAAQVSDPGAEVVFRTRVHPATTAQWQRLEDLGVSILERGDDWAVVLADVDQLEALARLRFRPEATDGLGALAEAHAESQPALVQSLRPLLEQAAGAAPDLATTDEHSVVLADVRTAMQALSPEQLAGIAALTSLDDDGDGLTNTQESWWCTDPADDDSDGDGATDGEEVQAAKHWLDNLTAGYPSTGKPFIGWPPDHAGCYDDDMDSIPDLAERWDLGLNMNRESTDRDKFDDGQELFGITYCPGSGGYCGYGTLPRDEEWGLIFAEMPAWVEPPGNHPMATAFPLPEVNVIPSSLVVETVTTVTTDHVIGEGTQHAYTTTKAEGTEASVANTKTWNEWEEFTEAREEPEEPPEEPDERDLGADAAQLAASTELRNCNLLNTVIGACRTIKDEHLLGLDATACWGYGRSAEVGSEWSVGGDVGLELIADVSLSVGQGSSVGAGLSFQEKAALNITCKAYLGRRLMELDPEELEGLRAAINFYNELESGTGTQRTDPVTTVVENHVNVNNSFDTSELVGGLEGLQNVYKQTGELIATQLREVAAYSKAPRITNATTQGASRGGAQTIGHTTYEEHATSDTEAFSSEESWGTATAEDSAHAADLWFTYQVRNRGTEYAREIADLAFTVYIGEDPNPVYTYFVGPDLGGDGVFHNFMPNEQHLYASRHIPLTLNQLREVDLGAAVRIVVEDFTYGMDEAFYEEAVNAGVQVAIEDGVDDGDELIESYLLPTWGEETFLQVLGRYFPHTTDANGNLVSIWTPEQRPDTPAWCDGARRAGGTLWCRHALSIADWWHVYMDGMEESSEGFQNSPAAGGSIALFRFNKDTDLDGYSDRTEWHLGTDPYDWSSHPRPELIGGIHEVQVGTEVTATLSLLNTGWYDAYGVEGIMIAQDDSISINTNTVGGSGRVRAMHHVVVGSRILSPVYDSTTWQGSAIPISAGYYTGGEDRVYTFTALDTGDVGNGTLQIAWNDGIGESGILDFGTGYASPLPLAVGSLGLEVGLVSGEVQATDIFTVSALVPIDTFQYTVNEEPHSPPVVILSYNDPQGNHRFVTSLALGSTTEDLIPHSDEMLENFGLQIAAMEPITRTGTHTTDMVLSWPVEATLEDAHLYMEIVNITGTVTSQISVTVDVPPGPSVIPMTWNTDNFSPTVQTDEDYVMMVFWTDYQGNILDTAARPLSSFHEDPLAEASATMEVDVGTLRWPAAFDKGDGLLGTSHTEGLVKASTSYQLIGSAGQPSAGTVMSSANYGLTPGYWKGVQVRQNQLPADATASRFTDSLETSNDAQDRFPAYRFPVADVGWLPLSMRVLTMDSDVSVWQEPAHDVSSGGFTELGARLNTNGLGLGPFERSVWLRTNDPRTPYLQLRFTGDVEPSRDQVFVYGYEDQARPWNKMAHVNSTRLLGEVVRLEHGIGGDTDALHPLFLYAGDEATLLGLGAAIDGASPVISQAPGDSAMTDLTLVDSTAERRDYILYYGYQGDLPDGGGQHTFQVAVPNENYGDVTLDVVVHEPVNDTISMSLDVGADGSNEWSFSGDTSLTDGIVPAGGLADAVNAYLDAQGGDEVVVPIRLSSDTEATYFLANLRGLESTDHDLSFPGSITVAGGAPVETDVVDVCADVMNDGQGDVRAAVVSFYAGDPTVDGLLIGHDLLTNLAAEGGQTQGCVDWDTSGYTGTLEVWAYLDVTEQIEENDETNNTTSTEVTVLTRPDLHVPGIALSDLEPVAGESVTVDATLRNDGQTAADPSTMALYDGDPEAGGTLVDEDTLPVGAGGETAAALTWVPSAPGPYRLYAYGDEADVVDEYDEDNNLGWLDTYVGLAGPIALDSGGEPDPPYTSTLGYGYLSQDSWVVSCDTGPDGTLRADSGTLYYRFDHLLPGHYYHLDVTLRDCDGTRVEEVYVDDSLVAGPVDLTDYLPHRLSILLDPALYADHTVIVGISDIHGLGGRVAQIALHDVDYRYADAGGCLDCASDPAYPAEGVERSYGWLDGEQHTAWGTLPKQSVRIDWSDSDPADDPDSELRYRFDALDPGRAYQIHLTFRQMSGANVVQKVQIDGTDASPSFDLVDGETYSMTLSVPLAAYQIDSSIDVGIQRIDCATSEAFVNEIALEEVTLPSSSPCENVNPTPDRTIAFGPVTISGQPAPVGTVVQAFTPRDEMVGCATVQTAGWYPYMQIYGEDPPDIPGMRDGEIVEFRVNGVPAVAGPALYWENDATAHQVELSTGSTEAQCTWLAPNWNLISFPFDLPVPTVEQGLRSIDGRYCRVLGETQIYDCTVDPVYRTLKELYPGNAYYLRLEGDTGANLRMEGVPIPVTTTISLHEYWNWVGYLPDTTLPITTALDSIDGQYLMVLSLDKTYDPAHPEFSDLLTMEPGQGYLIRATEPVSLTYPAGEMTAEARSSWVSATGCDHVVPTPFLTMVYGELSLGDIPAPAGTRVEIVTPRGEIAGCFIVRHSGRYGYVHVYGADDREPAISGFRDGESLAFRVNGRTTTPSTALIWSDDLTPHWVDLVTDIYPVYLPLVMREE